MKNLKLFLDDDEQEDFSLGLVRLTKHIAAHELFYRINNLNPDSPFQRIADIQKCGRYNDYLHICFESQHCENKTKILFIQNQSCQTIVKEAQTELFSGEEDVNYLLPLQPDVDYILKTSDDIPDFSLILLPENLMFPIQNFKLSSDDELFQLIQYYE